SRGPALWSLGVALTGTVNVVELARNELEQVCRETNANASLSRHLGNGNMQVILHVGGAFDYRRMFRHDISVPFPSGVASVILAWEEPDRVAEIYQSRTPSPGEPEFLRDLASYEAELAAIRGRGYHVGTVSTPFPDLIAAF